MKKSARLLRVFGVAGLLLSLLAASVVPAVAQDDVDRSQNWLDALIGVDGVGFLTGDGAIFYPWVANGDVFDDVLGPTQTTISIQNLEDRDALIKVYVGDGGGDFDLATSTYLTAFASKTFSAGDIGIAPGSGAPVKVISFNEASLYGFPAGRGVPAEAFEDVPTRAILVETPVRLSNPISGENDGGQSTQVTVCVVNFHIPAQPNFGHPWGYVAAVDHTFITDEGADKVLEAGEWLGHPFTQQELQDTLNAANADNPDELVNPFSGLNDDGDCFDVVEPDAYTLNDGVAIGGVAKQTAGGPVPDEADEDIALHQDGSTDIAVSGYNAVNGIEIDQFHQWYLPIVQTNGGIGGKWNSIIRVANLEFTNNAVTVRFFPNEEDGSGSLKTGFQLQKLVNGGATWSIDISDEVPEDWTGSVHILSDGAVFAMVDRYKPTTRMWITNTGSSADFEVAAQVPNANGRFALFAPHVLMDYYGWSTGINVANLVEADNNVSIQYFNTLGNATEVLNQRLAPHGMTYFYDPSDAAQDNNSQDESIDPNAGVVGSAIIWSEYPVAAAVDGVKYAGDSLSTGQATSYNATANIFPWQAVPYVTRGDATDGSGATSGINIMNPNAMAATANVYWVNPSGFQADNFGTSSVTIPAFANGFVYTLWQHNLPNGFEGAAQVVSTLPVAAVSANVNYGVAGDGSAIFNAFNPCGFYRVGGTCSFGDTLEPGGQSITKQFVDEAGGGVPGVVFSITSTSGASYQREATSGVDGSARLSNVPVGTYDLTVLEVPAGFVQPEGVQETIVVAEGQDVVVTNPLTWAQGFTKTVCVADLGSTLGVQDPQDPTPVLECAETNLVGVSVVVYRNIGSDLLGAPVAGDMVFEGETGEDGTISANLAPGNYILCMYDEDGVVTTTNGETVNVALPDQVAVTALCSDEIADLMQFDSFGDLFSVGAGERVELANPVFVTNGVINIFVGTQGDVAGSSLAHHSGNLIGVGDVQVCVDMENPYTNQRVEKCAVSARDGTVSIIVDASAGASVTGTDANLLQAPSFEIWEGYWIGVSAYTNEYRFICVEGGELTATPTGMSVVLCDGPRPQSAPDDGTTSLQQSRTQITAFGAVYEPSADIAQDGYLDDKPSPGSWDLVIEVDSLID